MRVAFLAVACVLCSTHSRAEDTKAPPNTPQDTGDRVYVKDTGIYEATSTLGKIGIVEDGKVSLFIEKPKSLCTYEKMVAGTKVTQMPGAQALEITVSQGYSGSLGFFVLSAGLTSEQKMTLTVDDLATAAISVPCSLGSADIRRIATSIPMARGKRVIYVTETTLSHLTKQVFDHQEANAGFSAGSWLKIGADGYKSNGRVDSVPLTAVRGIYVDVPSAPVTAAALANLKVIPFSKISEVSLSGPMLQLGDPIKVSLPAIAKAPK